MYALIRKVFFGLEPEKAHYTAMNLLQGLTSLPGGKPALQRLFQIPQGLQKTEFGLFFRNPVGLGAGFDKNARYLTELDALGFGFVEIGTVTPRPQTGNDKPRLFRLVQDKALINRMGFNNDGVAVIAERLKQWRQKNDSSRLIVDSKEKGRGPELKAANDKERTGARNTINRQPSTVNAPLLIGGNIGKNKTTPNEEAWKDYEICFRALHPFVDFFVVNVSSPNTPGLRELQERDALHRILTHLQALNKNFEVQRPLLLKIAPDLSWSQLDDVIALAKEIGLDGLVATNTTISREGLHTPAAVLEAIGAGGLSGAPLKRRATEVVQYLCSRLQGQIPVIASGGIFTAADAAEKRAAGAALCEVWTGFIYEGPFIVKNICKHLEQTVEGRKW